jgi:hypothetical protein
VLCTPLCIRSHLLFTPGLPLAMRLTGLPACPDAQPGPPEVGYKWIGKQRQLRAPSPDQTVSRGVKRSS